MKLSQKIRNVEKIIDANAVFSSSDLKNLLQPPSIPAFYQQLEKLEAHGIIKKFCRGIYFAGKPNLEMISQRLCPESYISFGNVLAKELVIGSIPHQSIFAVKTGKKRIYQHPLGEIRYFGISSTLFLGYSNKNGIRYACKEKAFLDVLYFFQKGQKFNFSVDELNTKILDFKKTEAFLSKYKNPKFKKFVRGVLYDRN